MSVSTNGASPRTSGASPLPELEGEWESLHEEEGEGEEFLGSLAGLARRAAQSALGGVTGGGQDQEWEWETEFETELEGEFEDESLYEEEGEGEFEFEGEFEDELEGMANPLRRLAPDAMMEHLGHAAAETESEAEAEAFVGALAPIAIGLARRAAPALIRTAPQLVRGLANVTRTLRRNPATRPLVRTLPTIAARTARSLARQVAAGRPVTARSTVRTLAGQTAAVLSDPRRRAAVVRRSRALDRRYHRAMRPGAPAGAAVAPASTRAVRTVAAGAPSAPARAYRRPYGPRSVAVPRGVPGRPAGLPPMSVAWVPVPAYRPAGRRTADGPYGY
jgi:hypothetical protein